MKTLDLQEIRQSLEKDRRVLLERLRNGYQETVAYEPINPTRSDLAWRYDWLQRKKLLLEQAKKQLSDVERALMRLENGEYGKCIRCNQPIHPDRLKVLPKAALCVNCKHKYE